MRSDTAVQTYATEKSENDQLQPLNPQDVPPAFATSGVPAEMMLKRKCVISKPAKSTMQSGPQSAQYQVAFDVDQEHARKWQNPLMGWASSDDPMQGTPLKFTSLTAAVRHCERQGWQYEIREPQYAKFVPKMYADNYKYTDKPLRFVKTK